MLSSFKLLLSIQPSSLGFPLFHLIFLCRLRRCSLTPRLRKCSPFFLLLLNSCFLCLGLSPVWNLILYSWGFGATNSSVPSGKAPSSGVAPGELPLLAASLPQEHHLCHLPRPQPPAVLPTRWLDPRGSPPEFPHPRCPSRTQAGVLHFLTLLAQVTHAQ